MAKAARRAKSIAVTDLSAEVRSAVSAALKSNAKFRGAEERIGIFPWPIIIGLILRDRGASTNLAELNKLAADIAGGIKGAGDPAVLIKGGDITVGYWPGPNFLSLR